MARFPWACPWEYVKPIYVTNREEVNESGATEAWFGRGVVYTAEAEPAVNTTLESVNFLDGTTRICRYALANCTNLTNVEIPESVVSIGERAFSNCYSLSEIAMPDSVTTIEDEAFNWCTSLSNITLGNQTSTIGYMGVPWMRQPQRCPCGRLHGRGVGQAVPGNGHSGRDNNPSQIGVILVFSTTIKMIQFKNNFQYQKGNVIIE